MIVIEAESRTKPRCSGVSSDVGENRETKLTEGLTDSTRWELIVPAVTAILCGRTCWGERSNSF